MKAKKLKSYLYFQLTYCIREFYDIGYTRIIRPKVNLLKHAKEVNPHKRSLQKHT